MYIYIYIYIYIYFVFQIIFVQAERDEHVPSQIIHKIERRPSFDLWLQRVRSVESGQKKIYIVGTLSQEASELSSDIVGCSMSGKINSVAEFVQGDVFLLLLSKSVNKKSEIKKKIKKKKGCVCGRAGWLATHLNVFAELNAIPCLASGS